MPPRASLKSGKRAATDDSQSPPPQAKKAKSSKAAAAGGGVDKDGNAYWELSNTRRVTISEFKKKTYVGIREFYEKDGELLPGKKGISLSIEQYAALIEHLPAIEAALKEQGETIPRPSYDGVVKSDGAADIEDVEEKEGKEEPKKPKKSNIEATSDEEEE